MAVLAYFPKLERGRGLAYCEHFLHKFSEKCFLFNTLSIDKDSIIFFFYFSRYQTKCIIKFLFTELMTSQTLRFISNHLLKQCPREKKKEKMKVQKYIKKFNVWETQLFD